MLTALLFDLDGTLTDTDTLHLQAFRQLLREHDGRELSQAQFEAQVSGRANGELFAELFPLCSPANAWPWPSARRHCSASCRLA